MDEDFRAERRRFILAAHPDRGGDASSFVAGLQRFDDAATRDLADTTPADTVTDGPEANWPVSLLTLFLRGLRGPHVRGH
jgi:hypothetical protein